MRHLRPGFCLILAAALFASAARAHFLLNINIRVIHVAHLEDGVRVFLRVPMPLLVADLVGPGRADGTRAPAPYTTNRIEDGQLMHYLGIEALRRDPQGLGRLVAEGHHLLVDGKEVEPRVEAVRAHAAISQPLFSTLEQARAALREPADYARYESAPYVGDTVVDAALFYPTGGPTYAFSFGSSLRPGLEGEEKTANLLLDHAGGETQVYRANGLLEDPIDVSRSPFKAILTFTKEGVRHILAGADHMLFVLCLTIGALTFGNLLWRVTGFTVGHTITLSAGFFGFVPSGGWFIPAVEAAIALSIVYVGVAAMLERQRAATFGITAAIGILHGLGFSFVLHEILKLDSPNLWVSLLSFNVGIELGQIGLILLVWPLLYLLDRRIPRVARFSRVAIILPCIAIAALWTGQRLGLMWQQGFA